MRFVYLEHPGLIRYWIVPILLTAIALGAAIWSAWTYHEALVSHFWAEPQGQAWWSAVARFAHSALEVLALLLLGAIAFIVVITFSALIAAPFNDALSEAVERIVLGKEGPELSVAILLRDLGRTLRLELLKLSVYWLIMLPALLLSWIVPVVGNILYTIFGALFTSFYLAVDYVDWPATRRNMGVRRRLRWARERSGTLLGFGAGVWILLFIPLVNLLFMPAAVAGGTLLFIDFERAANPSERQ